MGHQRLMGERFPRDVLDQLARGIALPHLMNVLSQPIAQRAKLAGRELFFQSAEVAVGLLEELRGVEVA